MAEVSLAQATCKFIDECPTPFHLCAETGALLKAAGFTEIAEDGAWRPLLKPGGSYFYTRAGTTLVAFHVGAAFEAGNGINVVGGHTDSPVLKLKPSSKKSAHGYLQLNVETYGGGLWHTWFDRELTLAGSVIVKQADGSFARRLLFVRRPLMRVPSLCIHLRTAEEREKFAPNKETHLAPILACAVSEALNADKPSASSLGGRHAPELLRRLSRTLPATSGDVLDFDLTLCDTQPSATRDYARDWGADEFLSAPRLDNQLTCYLAMLALIDHAKEAPPSQPDVAMIALFDHEEVGSGSAQGACSTVMSDALQRVSSCFAPDERHASVEALSKTARRSFLMAADLAHAVHPNYAEKHEKEHAPKLNSGTVIKSNDNQRYATNDATGFVVRELARLAGLAVQEFMVKNDCPCGSTIGPLISQSTGLRTVDIGAPCLSMHSIRETVGVADVENYLQLMKAFFGRFAELEGKCNFGLEFGAVRLASMSVCQPSVKAPAA
ncbi:hypothetical protein EMIHUDRAFT_430284 [Emiliania huxleyi CCMP1516]|uniref:aspartyl aminopeptidase n=2 Tax=Emiliania huxleyi TaxID=2903 RepID=A0A0D3JN98_EMIH1|nr:hypothetical protein EMIHUDRAFT_430284 [Emiliania huxleyi CCMP1516]EOD24983.1 hypothetical protein EMIHUDRAFT_430284 [Emiliania huxleyi CCMP1516]|eukprot:XP_005777412.1 hypothetical protein EMIHUDRAFT_430284 [Emiliania huxleyi CCMP1516]